jgi:hypothetical protein
MTKGMCPFCGKIIIIQKDDDDDDDDIVTAWPSSYILNGHKNNEGIPCEGSGKPPSIERII